MRKEQIVIWTVLGFITTCGNWLSGIVFFDSDLVFTVTNVVAHCIPYLALVLFYQNGKEPRLNLSKAWKYGALVVGSVLILAMSEEYLWDLLVYRENEAFFTSIIAYPDREFGFGWQHVALALLSVPQTTHYILDGFIWKNNASNPHLKTVLFR